MKILRSNRVAIATILIVGISAIVVWLLYSLFTFRVTSTTPKPNKSVASSTSSFYVSFNQQLADGVEYKQRLTGKDAGIVKSVQTKNREITIYLNDLSSDRNYQFYLNQIEAKNGSIIKTVAFDFRTVYKPFSKLSKKEKQLQIDQTDINAVEDPLEKYLPHGDLAYYLTGIQVTTSDTSQLNLSARITLSKADTGSGRDVAIAAQKQKIQEYIRSVGLDPSNYPITYEIIDPPF